MRARIGIVSAALLISAAPFGSANAAAPTGQVVLVSQAEELDAYNIDTGLMRTLVQASDYVNGPPCFIPGDPQGRFLEADDNPNETWGTTNGEADPFYGLFDKNGSRDFSTSIGDQGRIGTTAGMNDPAGCAFDAAGNLFGIDVGTVHAPIVGDGQLAEFFAPDYKTYCILDSNLAQPGMSAFYDGALYVPEAGFGQIDRFTNLPTSASECAPVKDVWMQAAALGIGTPIGIVRAPGSGWAVSSVLVTPGVFHVTDDGITDGVLAAPGPETGTPFGLGFDRNGSLYFADLGVRPFPLDGFDPSDPIDAAEGSGAFRVVRAGGPPLPSAIATGWSFPDGVTVVDASAISF